MYYVFLSAIILVILRTIVSEMYSERQKNKAGKVTLKKNIIELSKKGKGR